MGACSVPDSVFSAGDSVVSKVDKVLMFLLLTAWEETDKHTQSVNWNCEVPRRERTKCGRGVLSRI